MTAKQGNRSKALRIVEIILAAIITVPAVFTILSHPLYPIPEADEAFRQVCDILRQ